MTPNPRLSARYAKAVLDLAIEKGQLDAVYNDMLFLDAACQSSRELVNVLRSPIIKADKKGSILEAITAGKVSDITASFTRLTLQPGPILRAARIAACGVSSSDAAVWLRRVGSLESRSTGSPFAPSLSEGTGVNRMSAVAS